METATAPPGPEPSTVRRLAPGLALCLAIALVATGLGTLAPVVGAPVCAIVVGAVVASLVRPGGPTEPGAAWAGRYVLQASVVVLGTGLSISQVLHTGARSLPVMLGTLAVALVGAWLIGRALGLDRDTRTLIGVGTGICGASAIAATQSVIRASVSDVTYAIGTIFTFNVAAVLLFPPVGRMLGLDDNAFGLWAGTAVNDTSSVVAAAYSFSAAAGAYGVVVKLTRTLMIVPVTVALALWRRRAAPASDGTVGGVPWRRIVPLFLLWFLVAVGASSLGWVPAGWHPALGTLGGFLITVALAGIGLGTRVSVLRQAGLRPLVLGASLWVLVAVSSLALQALTGTLSTS